MGRRGGGSLKAWGGGSLTVWGGFTFNHRTQLHVFRRVNAAVYHLIPFFAAQPRYVNSMKRHRTACLNARGGHTRY